MNAEDFSKFVEDQQQTAEESNVDWTKVRDAWLGELDSLHRRIVDYLRAYIDDGSISLRFTEVMLTEENIGRYLAKRMDIKIGRQLVYLEPIGTLLIGSKGRVDAVGSAGRAQLVLVNARARSAADLIAVRVTVAGKGSATVAPRPAKQAISWTWKIVTNTSPKKFVDLEKKPFLAMLMEIANAW